MTTIKILPANGRFGKSRKRTQWRFVIVAANGTTISDRDSYANRADILAAFQNIAFGPLRVQFYDRDGSLESTVVLRAEAVE